VVYDDPPSRYDLAASSELSPMRLKRSEIDSLMDFLHALTDRNSLDIRDATPSSVPSGLPLYD
jgi:cytochrome c peroxidase